MRTRTGIFTTMLSVLGMLGCLAFSYPALADSPAQLKTELVVEKDGKFTLDRVRLCQVFRPEELGGGATPPFQVKAHMEAPTTVISRDRFVALGTELAVGLRVNFASDLIKELTPGQALQALQCKQVEAAIGTVDLEVSIVMTSDGMQIEITETDSGQKQKQTTTWEQVLGE